ncbi:MAG: NAD(P)/FAD-dependent oxidoreductase [Betaproteobacteria bacterium]|nr:NAD(P)/FAD-dependent oxidoreductase [Betaproteobacteria bacterium]
MAEENGASPEIVEVAGAGPAGLAAAITLARAGRRVIVHEAQRELGYRFQGDLQGLENWTTDQDVLDWLHSEGITTEFRKFPCREGTAFDAWGHAYPMASRDPIFYVVERGPAPGSLDSALLAQAQALGIEVRFNSPLKRIAGPGILATGPKAADAIAVGYHFDTAMNDGFWTICDDYIAPRGYAYVLVMGGKGTVKSCMFSGFKQERIYVERTVEAFRRLIGLKMENARPHGGAGNFRIPERALAGSHPMVGELAGFQDTLWGFGMRMAMLSGKMAALSLLHGDDYDRLWRQSLERLMATSVFNRALYSLLGNHGYRWLLLRRARRDPRAFLGRLYSPSAASRILGPWARSRYRSLRSDVSCNHVDCTCVWCRCGGAEAIGTGT